MQISIIRALGLVVCLLGATAARAAEKTVELAISGNIALGDLVVPEGASLANGVVLLTHGALAHKDQELIEALQTSLAERGVPTLAHSLTFGQDRRTGMYDCSVPHAHKHEDAVAEIAAWVDWLKNQGAQRISLLGHSLGGNQVAWFAARSGAIESVILVAPATGVSPQRTAEIYKSRFGADLAPIVKKAVALVGSGKGETMLDVAGFIYCPAGKATAHSIVSYYAPNPKRATPTHIPAIKPKVLVIAGSKDTVVPDVVEKFGKLADGKKLRLEVIKDADHMFLDFYADDAADKIAAFLKD